MYFLEVLSRDHTPIEPIKGSTPQRNHPNPTDTFILYCVLVAPLLVWWSFSGRGEGYYEAKHARHGGGVSLAHLSKRHFDTLVTKAVLDAYMCVVL